jgi:hypothetical protein
MGFYRLYAQVQHRAGHLIGMSFSDQFDDALLPRGKDSLMFVEVKILKQLF